MTDVGLHYVALRPGEHDWIDCEDCGDIHCFDCLVWFETSTNKSWREIAPRCLENPVEGPMPEAAYLAGWEIEITMDTLHVWTADDEEFVVAASAEDACAVYCEHAELERDTSEDGEDSDWGTRPEHWTELADDHVIPIGEECQEPSHVDGAVCPKGCDDQFILRSTPTCAELIAANGRGYLWSSNG